MTGIPRLYGRQERRRPPRPLLLGTAAVLALVAVIAWSRYDPVVGGSAGWCPRDSVLVAEDDIDQATGVPQAVCTVVGVDRGPVAFATSVRNDGLLPIWVRSARLSGEIQGVLRVDEVRMAARNDLASHTSRELVPFRAFRLGPGQERLIEVAGTLTPCEETSTARAATFRSLPLRTTLLWLPRDSQAPFDPPVRLIAEPC